MLAIKAADQLTFADWQTASAQDANSYSGNPGFTSATDLMPNPADPNSTILNNHGTPIAGITADINGTVRDASTPDIGAYEFEGVSS